MLKDSGHRKMRLRHIVSDEKKETFESLVDLFTILSFVLIAVAFFFGIQQPKTSGNSMSSAEFDFEKVRRGGTPTTEIPDDTIVILIYKENSSEAFQIIRKGIRSISYHQEDSNINEILKNEFQNISSTGKIHIVAIEEQNGETFSILYNIQKWLAINSFNNIKIYFSNINNG